MNQNLTFFAPGLPVGQPRAKATAFAGRARVYDPGTANKWKACIIHAAKEHNPAGFIISGPVAMFMTFYLPRPMGHFGTGKNAGILKAGAPKYPTSKPDLDNMEKAVLDALNSASVWLDDAQVVQTHSCKIYAGNGIPTGCQINLQIMEGK